MKAQTLNTFQFTDITIGTLGHINDSTNIEYI